jgi:hypothetical protein
MTDERQPGEAPDESRRDIFAAELAGEPGPDGLNPVASEIGGWISRALEFLRARSRRKKGIPPAHEPTRGSILAGQATATAVGALEGKLRSTSLDGLLKEAHILDAYASARQKNAEAERQEVETEKLRQDLAFQRLERVIALCEKAGAKVELVQSPGGGIAITIGARLVGELPELSGPEESDGPLLFGPFAKLGTVSDAEASPTEPPAQPGDGAKGSA